MPWAMAAWIEFGRARRADEFAMHTKLQAAIAGQGWMIAFEIAKQVTNLVPAIKNYNNTAYDKPAKRGLERI